MRASKRNRNKLPGTNTADDTWTAFGHIESITRETICAALRTNEPDPAIRLADIITLAKTINLAYDNDRLNFMLNGYTDQDPGYDEAYKLWPMIRAYVATDPENHLPELIAALPHPCKLYVDTSDDPWDLVSSTDGPADGPWCPLLPDGSPDLDNWR